MTTTSTAPKTITVDGTTYTRQDQPAPIRIVILQRGWVMVGRYTENSDRVTLTDAHVIRYWGTTKGLGQLAAEGPTSKTILDPAGRVEAHILTTVAVMDCDLAVWETVLS